MILTEEQAKTKWCPFARATSNGAVANRDNGNDGLVTNFDTACLCVASDCMAWRWAHQVQATDETWNVLERRNEQTSKGKMGFCGLGGRA